MIGEEYYWNGTPMRGLCGHCNVMVDSYDPNHRVTSISSGGRGVECVLRGDITVFEGGPLNGLERLQTTARHRTIRLIDSTTGECFQWFADGIDELDGSPWIESSLQLALNTVPALNAAIDRELTRGRSIEIRINSEETAP